MSDVHFYNILTMSQKIVFFAHHTYMLYIFKFSSVVTSIALKISSKRSKTKLFTSPTANCSLLNQTIKLKHYIIEKIYLFRIGKQTTITDFYQFNLYIIPTVNNLIYLYNVINHCE